MDQDQISHDYAVADAPGDVVEDRHRNLCFVQARQKMLVGAVMEFVEGANVGGARMTIKIVSVSGQAVQQRRSQWFADRQSGFNQILGQNSAGRTIAFAQINEWGAGVFAARMVIDNDVGDRRIFSPETWLSIDHGNQIRLRQFFIFEPFNWFFEVAQQQSVLIALNFAGVTNQRIASGSAPDGCQSKRRADRVRVGIGIHQDQGLAGIAG